VNRANAVSKLHETFVYLSYGCHLEQDMNGFCNVLSMLWFRLLHRRTGGGNPLKTGPWRMSARKIVRLFIPKTCIML